MKRLLIIACFLFLGGAPLAAQEDEGQGAAGLPSSGQARGGLASLQNLVTGLAETPGYTREVFTYPRFGRVDPVVPPAAMASLGALPELTLSGVLFNEQNPSASAAIVHVKGRATERRVLRAGDRIEQYEVVQVERNRVALDVHLLGMVKRVYLERESETEQETGSGGAN